MTILRRLFFVVLFVALLYGGWQFVHANAVPVSVNLITLELSAAPLWIVLLLSFASGVAVTLALMSLRLLRSGLTTRRYRKAVDGLESEVHELRNLPVVADDLAIRSTLGAPELAYREATAPADAAGPQRLPVS